MRNYVDGAWQKAQGTQTWTSRSPADRTDTLGEFVEDLSAADDAVAAARKAQAGWEALGQAGRNEVLERFAAELAARKPQIAEVIAREVGKPLWEAVGEAGALSAKVGVTLTASLAEVQGRLMKGSQSWVDGGYRYRPVGVCVVPGPFNFPLHLANGHIIAALAVGNTAIFKPSEMAPRCAELYMEAADAAKLPAGVLNMVQGGPNAGKRLVGHKDIDAVLFTGSLAAGIAIRRATVEQPWKLLALEMGGKNTSIVMEDADLSRAAYEIAQGALMTCGQRCTGTSRVVVAHSLMESLAARLGEIWDGIKIGHPMEDDTFMGPLVNQASFERFLASAHTAREEGMEALRVNARAEGVMRGGKAVDGYYVKPALWRATQPARADGPHSGAEIFGPDVVLFEVPDGDEEAAAQVANATDYGLAMSIFTADEARFTRMEPLLRTGILNFNRSTAGATALMPFGGGKGSGNHRPAALVATHNCVYPVATLRNPQKLEAQEVMARFPVAALGLDS